MAPKKVAPRPLAGADGVPPGLSPDIHLSWPGLALVSDRTARERSVTLAMLDIDLALVGNALHSLHNMEYQIHVRHLETTTLGTRQPILTGQATGKDIARADA